MLKIRLIFIIMLFFFKGYAQTNLYDYYENGKHLNNIYINDTGYFAKKDLTKNYFDLYPSKKLNGLLETSTSPKGYHVVYEIEGNELYVKELWILKITDGGLYTNITDEIFPAKVDRKMNWYSGLILFTSGKGRLDGMNINYEKNVLFEINKGNIITIQHFNLEQILAYKERLFEVFKKTEEYKIIKKEGRERGWKDSTTDSFYQNIVLDYYNTMIIK